LYEQLKVGVHLAWERFFHLQLQSDVSNFKCRLHNALDRLNYGISFVGIILDARSSLIDIENLFKVKSPIRNLLCITLRSQNLSQLYLATIKLNLQALQTIH